MDFEADVRTPRPADLHAMRQALEVAGVEFIDGPEPGVRLKEG